MTLPDVFYPIAGTADEVATAVKAGARFIQLRAKSPDRDYLTAEVRAALKSCSAAGAQLVVNDHWEIALDEGAEYIHLGQEDMLSADISYIHKAGVKLGISTHDHAELEKARAVNPAYIALGPVWETTLKVMPWAPQGVERVKEWCQRIAPIPLVAIGGITAERSLLCLEAGASAVSAVSDIFRKGDIATRVQSWQKIMAGRRV